MFSTLCISSKPCALHPVPELGYRDPREVPGTLKGLGFRIYVGCRFRGTLSFDMFLEGRTICVWFDGASTAPSAEGCLQKGASGSTPYRGVRGSRFTVCRSARKNLQRGFSGPGSSQQSAWLHPYVGPLYFSEEYTLALHFQFYSILHCSPNPEPLTLHPRPYSSCVDRSCNVSIWGSMFTRVSALSLSAVLVHSSAAAQRESADTGERILRLQKAQGRGGRAVRRCG